MSVKKKRLLTVDLLLDEAQLAGGAIGSKSDAVEVVLAHLLEQLKPAGFATASVGTATAATDAAAAAAASGRASASVISHDRSEEAAPRGDASVSTRRTEERMKRKLLVHCAIGCDISLTTEALSFRQRGYYLRIYTPAALYVCIYINYTWSLALSPLFIPFDSEICAARGSTALWSREQA